MKLSKKKRIRRKQIKSYLSSVHPLKRQWITESIDIVMFGSPLNEGKGWAGNLPTQITISPDCKTEFIITSQGFKEFHQQTES